MIVGGVKTQQRATVTYQDIPNQRFVLGRGFLEPTGLRRATDSYGRVAIDANASTTARLVMNEVEVKAKALLDTGAGPNVMTEELWRKMKSDRLLEAAPHLYSADRSTIKVHGKTPPILVHLDEGEAMPVQFHVIASKSQENLILGREFMTEYQVLVDFIMWKLGFISQDGTCNSQSP